MVHLRKQPWVNICYFKTYSRNPEVHRRIAEWTKQTEAHTSAYCVGVAMISPSIGFRFVLSSVFLMKRLPCPHEVCSNWDAAVAFVQREADARGMQLPPIVRPWPDIP
jgi:hypothetical protein